MDLLDIHIYTRVSLIAGMEYGMEQWNGKWNGTVNVHSCVLQVLSFKVELATVCLGLLSHHRGCMRKSSACCQHSQSLSGITVSQSKLGVPGDQPIPCIGATLTTILLLRKVATKDKVVRPRSDRGLRCTDGKD